MNTKDTLTLTILTAHCMKAVSNLVGINNTLLAKAVVNDIANEVMELDKWLQGITEGEDDDLPDRRGA